MVVLRTGKFSSKLGKIGPKKKFWGVVLPPGTSFSSDLPLYGGIRKVYNFHCLSGWGAASSQSNKMLVSQSPWRGRVGRWVCWGCWDCWDCWDCGGCWGWRGRVGRWVFFSWFFPFNFWHYIFVLIIFERLPNVRGFLKDFDVMIEETLANVREYMTFSGDEEGWRLASCTCQGLDPA